MNKKAVLLANLGSPDAPDIPQVRKYLQQFLMDPYVIQLPWLLRALIVYLLVLPRRPANTAEAYRSVWTENGAPLVSISQQLAKAVQDKVDVPVAMGMRYGNPSIESQLQALAEIDGLSEVLFIPLYPHFADSTITTAIKEAERAIARHNLALKLKILPPFYDSEAYIDALVDSCQIWLQKDFDHVLFSYHGLPELHITRADPTGNHCLKTENCCQTPSVAHATCYRHQVLRTTQCFVEKTGLKPEQYSVAYQSRLGRAKWLEPSTEENLVRLARQGVKKLVVLCPAFVTDCLETLEEIDIQGRETFLQAGGEELIYEHCLNVTPRWVDCLASWIKQEMRE